MSKAVIIDEVKPTPIQGRAPYVDVIRVWGMFLVIALHVVGLYRYQSPASTSAEKWWIFNFIYTLTWTGVPLFLLISGTLLLNRTGEDTKLFFKKRFIKVIIPLVFWSILYGVWQRIFEDSDHGIVGIVILALKEPIEPHLWFIYMILGLYAVTPLLRLLLKSARLGDVLLFVGLWLFTIIEPQLFWVNGISVGIDFTFITGYIGYYMLGYLLSFVRFNKKWSLWLVVGVLVGVLFFSVWLIWVLFLRYDRHFTLTTEYLSLTIVIMTACQFIILKHIPYDKLFAKAPWLEKLIKLLSAYSLGIYVLHWLFLKILMFDVIGLNLMRKLPSEYIEIIILPLLAVVLCVIVISVLKKIPVLKHVVP